MVWNLWWKMIAIWWLIPINHFIDLSIISIFRQQHEKWIIFLFNILKSLSFHKNHEFNETLQINNFTKRTRKMSPFSPQKHIAILRKKSYHRTTFHWNLQDYIFPPSSRNTVALGRPMSPRKKHIKVQQSRWNYLV